jgi:hypothetical protein
MPHVHSYSYIADSTVVNSNKHMHSDKASMTAAPSEHIQVDRIGSEEPAQCCIASSKQLSFALSLSSFAKSVARMTCLLENKSAMHSALRHLFFAFASFYWS